MTLRTARGEATNRLKATNLTTNGEAVTIVAFSDSHEMESEITLPISDWLVCTGDFTMMSRSLRRIEEFNEWLGEQPQAIKLVVPGNHEHFLSADPARRSLLSNATVLIDETIEIDGLVVYGSPVTPLFGTAFGMPSAVDRKGHWAKIPDDTNLLITHGPPYGILDRSPGHRQHQGDPELLARVAELESLRLHCFGHVHGAYGIAERLGVTFANVALLGPSKA